MPEMDGIEFLIQVRQVFPEAKIIGMSGGSYLPKESVLETAHRCGAAGILAKPLDMDEVLSLVDSVLNDDVEP
jgi:DNA-binding NarL/FixJ family response regulator